MPSHPDNPNSTPGARRPTWWTIVAAVLLLGFVLAKPYWDESAGTSTERTGERSPAPATVGADDVVEPAVDDETEPGRLTEVRPDVFESPAGLVYGPGSREGHRIDHVMRHAADDPERPVHGVFDGDREIILTLLDEAYRIAQKRGPPVDVEQDDRRTVYTIDMERRVGFVGGESGRRDGHPDATHIRLVLEDRNVITAFPLRP